MNRLRIGIIGLGMASGQHAQGLVDIADRVEVAAAFSPSAARRNAFADRWDMPVVDDVDAIFADPSIRAVLILTPPFTHGELVARAAAAGKHVLLEKPLEITTERAERLVETAERAGIRLGIVLQHRFRPVSVALRALLAEGRLGALVGASARLANWRPQSYYDQPGRGTFARDGGGVLITQAIHTLDLLVSFAGRPVEAMAFATTTPIHRMESEDLVAGAVRFENGAIGTVGATTAAYPGEPDTIELIGTLGTARIAATGLTAAFQDGTALALDDGDTGGGAGADPMAFSHRHHRAVIEDFLGAIEDGRDPLVTGRSALAVHGLIDALLRSSRSGRKELV